MSKKNLTKTFCCVFVGVDFQSKVIHSSEEYTCKHVLAARLAGLIGKVKTVTVANDVFTFSLKLIESMTSNPNQIVDE